MNNLLKESARENGDFLVTEGYVTDLKNPSEEGFIVGEMLQLCISFRGDFSKKKFEECKLFKLLTKKIGDPVKSCRKVEGKKRKLSLDETKLYFYWGDKASIESSIFDLQTEAKKQIEQGNHCSFNVFELDGARTF